MIVHVRLHTALQQVSAESRTGQMDLEVPPGACVQDVLDQLGLIADDEALLLVLNRRMVGLEAPLADGDTLDLIPAISGG